MNIVTISTGWHKATDRGVITKKQLDYISDLVTKENCPDWYTEFPSTTQAMRKLTIADGAEIIDALKNGDKVEFE